MKIMKKIATLLLTVCLMVPCFSLLTYAAEGQIVFSDPSTAVGETVEVTGVVRAGQAIGDADLNLTYDSSYLKFVSGDNVTESGTGQLTYSGKGTGSETELRFKMNFEVLKEGSTKIEVSSYKAWLFSDESLNCQEGNSTVTIAQGNGNNSADSEAGQDDNNQNNTNSNQTSGVQVTVDGETFEVSESFSAAEVPLGFSEAAIEYKGSQYKGVKADGADMSLLYLVDSQGAGKFYIYNSSDSTFSAFEQIQVSETSAITLLTDKSAVKLPDTYQRTDISVNGNTFPAWINSDNSDFYIVYAMNSQGEKTLYQYDSSEGTYQRFEAPESDNVSNAGGILGKIQNVVQKYMLYVLIGAAAVLVILIVLIIVLAVKLRNRNLELDDWYDEYGSDLEVSEDEMEEPVKEEKKSLFKRKEVEEEPDDENLADEADFEDDDFETDDFEDGDFEEDDFEEDDFEEDDFEDDDFEEDSLEEDDSFDLDDDFEEESGRKRSIYDDFDVDFIDLDD